jgi:hypothetical protein
MTGSASGRSRRCWPGFRPAATAPRSSRGARSIVRLRNEVGRLAPLHRAHPSGARRAARPAGAPTTCSSSCSTEASSPATPGSALFRRHEGAARALGKAPARTPPSAARTRSRTWMTEKPGERTSRPGRPPPQAAPGEGKYWPSEGPPFRARCGSTATSPASPSRRLAGEVQGFVVPDDFTFTHVPHGQVPTLQQMVSGSPLKSAWFARCQVPASASPAALHGCQYDA